MRVLKPMEVPLHGTTLIEASAGTGKTYTITTLFLRLLLESRATVDQIVVVTFTVAATEELRIKLTARILEAVNWLKQAPGDESDDDPVLAGVLKQHDRQESLQLLLDVSARLDELAVYTIDSMCMRVLQDFAFESGLPMRMEFIADDNDIRTLVAEDYWRSVVGGSDELAIEELTTSFKSPSNLLKLLTPVLRAKTAVVLPDVDAAQLEQDRSRLTRRFFRIINEWEECADEVKEILRHSKAINRKKYNQTAVAKIISALDSLISRESLPTKSIEKFELVTDSTIAAAVKKNQQKPQHEFFNLCEGFDHEIEDFLKRRKAAILITAKEYCQRAIEQYKTQRGMLHFEDLRDRLDAALKGPSAGVLAEKVRQMWPYAMIDEFQDTDPQQNNIFRTIYGQRDNCGFFQIGDPKQAIYSFRGADVFTYMDAARNVSNHYTLGTNWRSSSGLVKGVNSLFEYARKPFIFDQHISFHPVDAAGKADNHPLLIDQQTVTPLQFRLLPANDEGGKWTAANALNTAAQACASDIAGLLKKGQRNQATLDGRPVRASDIAVLVRGHEERRKIQQALTQAGVKSVSLGTETVFSTREAHELSIILTAVVQPGRAGHIRRALVTEMIGYDAHRIEAINNVEREWDELFTCFLNYRDIWAARGFMAAIQTLIVEQQVAQKLLAYPDGERRMTNLLQLTELMQVKSRELSSQDELLVWLNQQNGSIPDEDQMLRLESDENLVQIVTIHKSKGLEYPIVYLPFPWKIADNNNESDRIVLFHDRDSFQSKVDFGSELKGQHKALRSQETLAEYIRLLYVAVTRAQHLCVMCWGDVNNAHNSALGYLLHQHPATAESLPVCCMKDMDIVAITDDLQSLAEKADGAISVMPLENKEERFESDFDYASLSCEAFTGRIDRQWKITSYSGMLSGEDNGLPDRDEISVVDPVAELEEQTVIDDSLGEIANLPAGARTGNMLHDLFENMNFTDATQHDDRVAQVLKTYGNLGRRGSVQLVDWAPVVKELLNNTLDTVLDTNSGFCLRELPSSDRRNEMGFFFSIDGVTSKKLNAVLGETSEYKNTASGLSFSSLTGLMRGYIDMVARKDGRYYIVDYKSNLLGDSRRFYNRESMQKTIRSHRYDLQYLIYTVALHRYLKTRIPGYQYERDFGGIFYLFVRGMKPGADAGVWHDRPSKEIIQALDACFDSSVQV